MSDADACVRAAFSSLTTGNQDMKIASLRSEPSVSSQMSRKEGSNFPSVKLLPCPGCGAAQRIASFSSCAQVRTPVSPSLPVSGSAAILPGANRRAHARRPDRGVHKARRHVVEFARLNLVLLWLFEARYQE